MDTTRLDIQRRPEKVEIGGRGGNIAAPATRLNWNHGTQKGAIAEYADFLDLVLESLPYPFETKYGCTTYRNHTPAIENAGILYDHSRGPFSGKDGR